MKTAFYTTLFTIFSFTITYSQTSLEGQVTDASNEKPIQFVAVSIYKNDVLVTEVETDENGHYFFSDINAGTYDIEVHYVGYLPQKHAGIIVKSGRTNRYDIEIFGGRLVPITDMIDSDYSTSSPTISSKAKRSLPTKHISGITKSTSGISSGSDLTIRGSRSDATLMYTTEGIKSYGYDAPRAATFERSSLPKSGQITAGEWNDLHNWKDWMALLEEENYSIMMERHEIRPVDRYSVIVVNQENTVLANVPVQLLDDRGGVVWETYTDNSGKAELWENVFVSDQHASAIKVRNQITEEIVKIEDGSNTIILKEDCTSPEKMDVVFVVDATSSMNDEIRYLKSELLDVIDRIEETNKDIDFNLGSVFYRDVKDEYLTRVAPLTSEMEEIVTFVGNQNSSGGGDNPEAVEAALEETLKLSWREDALKLVFLVLDAPPHEDDATMEKIRSQIKEAANRGIKLIPITASGIDRNTEFLMKFMAILTNGTYVFITDDSGIGNAHLDPVVEDYEVEKLNDCLVRLITHYSKSYSCDAEVDIEAGDLTFNVYPNPSTQFINVSTNQIPDKIKIYSANGMMVKSITPDQKETRIELGDFVNGIYTISIIIGDHIMNKQVILLK